MSKYSYPFIIDDDPQTFFDYTYRHFIHKEGPFAINGDGACLYRTQDGAACAVGIHIPDRAYSPHMEGEPLEDLMGQNYITFTDRETESLAVILQDAHDSTAVNGTRDGLKERLKKIADSFNLTIPDPE